MTASYRDRLQHWALVKHPESGQPQVVGRFHKRTDAEGHLSFMKRYAIGASFSVIFDPPQHQ